MFLVFVFFANLTTAFFLEGNNIYFVLYVAIGVTMCGKERTVHIAGRPATLRQNYV